MEKTLLVKRGYDITTIRLYEQFNDEALRLKINNHLQIMNEKLLTEKYRKQKLR